MLLRFRKPRFSRAMIRKIVTSGAPNFLNNIAGRITSILMNVLLVRLGGEIAVSIYGVLMYVEGFIQPLLYGMCDSLQPAVGYNWGARAFGRVKAIEACCFRAAAAISLISALVIFLIPAPIARVFMQDVDASVIADTAFALRLFSITYLTRWFSFATQSFMLAIERAGAATLISLSTALIFPVLLIAALWPLHLTGPVAQLCRHLGAGGHAGGGGHAAPEARLAALDGGAAAAVRAVLNALFPRIGWHCAGAFSATRRWSVCVSRGNWCFRSPSAWG